MDRRAGLPELSAAIRQQVDSIRVSLRTIRRYVEPDPRLGLGGARLRNEGVHLWALVNEGASSDSTVEAVADSYDIDPRSVIMAYKYYSRSRRTQEAVDRQREVIASFHQ